MRSFRIVAELIGWSVFFLWLAGTCGVGHFVLTYGP